MGSPLKTWRVAAVLTDGVAARMLRNSFSVQRKTLSRGTQQERVRCDRVLGWAAEGTLLSELVKEETRLQSLGYATHIRTFNAMLQCLSDCGQFDSAFALCKERAEVVGLDGFAYTALMRAAVFAGRHDMCLSLFQNASLAGIRVDSPMYGAMLASYQQQNLRDEFMTTFAALREGGEVIPSHYAMYISFITTTAEADEVLTLMGHDHVPITRDISMALFSSARRHQDPKAATYYHNLMELADAVSEREYTQLMNVYKESLDISMVRSTFEHLKQKAKPRSGMPHVVLLQAIANVIVQGDREALILEAENVFEECLEIGMTYHPWAALFNIYALVSDAVRAERLFERLKDAPPEVKEKRPIRVALSKHNLALQQKRKGFKVWHSAPFPESGAASLGGTPVLTSRHGVSHRGYPP